MEAAISAGDRAPMSSPIGPRMRAIVSASKPAFARRSAREAWVRRIRDEATVSNSQRALARIIGELGIRHEPERVTEDGYFSIDIYLPDHDVAVEFDGPTHYYEDASGQKTTTRTAATELRDMLLGKKCAKVVTVPYFEWGGLKTQELRVAYVRDKLARVVTVFVDAAGGEDRGVL